MDERRVGPGGQRNFGMGQSATGNLSGNIGPSHGPTPAQQGQGRFEDMVNQTRDAADEALELAEQAYERGRGYIKEEWNYYPAVDRYVREGRRIVGQQVGEHPIFAILLAGSIGYLFGYLIHGLSGNEAVPDYARTRAHYRRPGIAEP